MTAAATHHPLSAARAFGVVMGPSAIVDVAAGACVAETTRAVAHRRAPAPWALAGTAGVAAYARWARPWMRRWGATGSDADDGRPLHAVSIDAPVGDVWPWLAQIGQDRGGFYSYDWLENLAGCELHNAEAVHPEWQDRAPGDTVLLHPIVGMPITRFEPGRAISLEGWGEFVLEPEAGGRCRLIVRGEPARGIKALVYALLVEFPHFVMERKMLFGIKSRAERSRVTSSAPAATRSRDSAQAAAPATS
jgi:hypothetical protein